MGRIFLRFKVLVCDRLLDLWVDRSGKILNKVIKVRVITLFCFIFKRAPLTPNHDLMSQLRLIFY